MVMPWMEEGNIRHAISMMVNDPDIVLEALLVRVHGWVRITPSRTIISSIKLNPL